jgi:hypothetical protein
MEYQIILLPNKNYWDWVRACRDYIKHYGSNLTHDPGVAARYMSPAQVISFPVVPGGYPEQGDIEDWMQQHHPGIRLDPISASRPEDLQAEFELRIEQTDRYGQKRRPFYLLWPTDYSVVTQPFGANPHIYTRFGMPGHEGLDIRALMNTNIYCCADGEVYMVHTNPRTHAYGIHVRVRHKDGYKTVYGHLAQPLAKVGQEVSAGQVIGKADSTGASTGSHLHLTLKRDGATERGETIYPKDVIDPTPFMVWPERSRKTMPQSHWPMGKCLVGVHARTTGNIRDEDIELINELGPEALMISVSEDAATVKQIKERSPDIFMLAGLKGGFSDDPVTAEQFIGNTEPYINELYKLGIRYFEIASEPNVQNQGFGRSWRNGAEFANWFLAVVKTFRQKYKEAKFGFPGLSPGGDLSGWRGEYFHFLSEAEEAVAEADWIGIHAYWLDDLGMRAPSGGRIFEVYQRRYPDKLLFITEFNNPATQLTSKQRAEQYHEYLRMLRNEISLGAAFMYALSSDDDQLVFTLNRKGESIDEWLRPLKADKE